MNLLITPCLRLTAVQKDCLEEAHTLYFIEDERVPLSSLTVNFDLQSIDGIICNFFFLYHSLDDLPNLRLIQLTSAGLDRVPLEEIRRRGIQLYNVGDVYSVPIAEWTVWRILDFYKNGRFFEQKQSAHVWEKNRQVKELDGRTALIIGYGHNGRETARRLKAFDMRITAVDVYTPSEDGILDDFYRFEDLDKALAEADVVILTLPYTQKTHHLVNDSFLSHMKKGSLLINSARGKLVDETALLKALNDGTLSGCALDVFETEPLPEQSPLWKRPDVYITPHNSFVGDRNNDRLFEKIRSNLAGA